MENNKEADENQQELSEASPDYVQGSAEDETHDAPTGKEALTPTDAKLEEDQAATQPDSS